MLVALKNRIEFKVDLLKEIEDKNQSVLYISELIESVLPSDVLYISVEFDSEESIKILGRTTKEPQIPDLMHKIREMNVFKNIEAEKITKKIQEVNYKGEETYYNFILLCSFGGDDNETDE